VYKLVKIFAILQLEAHSKIIEAIPIIEAEHSGLYRQHSDLQINASPR